MKTFTKYFLVAITFMMLNFVFITVTYANSPPPPPPPAHDQTGNVPGGGSPIGGGVLILAILGAGYGVKKWYDNHKKPLAE